MPKSIFTTPVVVSPDYTGQHGRLTPLGVFTVFQNIASQHAEEIGVGISALEAKKIFWLTVHTRVDFFSPASLLDELTAETWPEKCEARAYRSYRSYSLKRGEELIALGRTQWVVYGAEGRILNFGAAGFPEDYVFSDRTGITASPTRFTDDFTEADFVGKHIVRSTDIDIGHHMNNVAYVRALLDFFPAEELDSGKIRSMEVHYSAQCREGEELSVYLKHDGELCRMAVKKPDGKNALFAGVKFEG